MTSLTPMMRQYLKIHEEAPDALLFFRLGDFYEMFFDDAIAASKALDLVLTGRDCGLDEKAPMCGVPYHSVDTYIAKLVEKGYKVAICEQVSDPKTSKGIVDRQITRIISSGTLIEGKALSEDRSSYIACVYYNKTEAAVAYCDVSTGETYAKYLSGENLEVNFLNYLGVLRPAELLCSTVLYSQTKLKEQTELICQRPAVPLSSGYFSLSAASEEIKKQLGIYSLNAAGVENNETLIRACGALFIYLRETQKNNLDHIKRIRIVSDSDFMHLDYSTKRNLELTETLRSSSKKGSLLWVLDKTSSAVGARTLFKWVNEPLISKELIIQRHEALSSLVSDFMLIEDIQTVISSTSDIQRLCSKVSYKSINGRELLSLKETINLLPKLKILAARTGSGLLFDLCDEMEDLSDVSEYIERSIDEECTAAAKDGNLIKLGYDSEIDELKKLKNNAKEILIEIEAREKEASGIKNLKIKYNKVFGYYFEITNSNLSNVPSHFIRKQTLVNAERFFTEELKELEVRLLNAQDDIIRRENELYDVIVNFLTDNLQRIQTASRNIGIIDALNSMAFVSYKNGYVRAEINDEGTVRINDGRHPVIEQITGRQNFIENDTYLDSESNTMILITGPNMAGKSTYIRQTAVIALMNQIGCFVPCSSADMCIIDRIFTRVGASDDIGSGQSTFMVEMSEVSNILKNATKQSLIILDEVGRGTSTFDGLSIAWSVLEFLSSDDGAGTKCLFATHYHELTELEKSMPGVVNYSIKLLQTEEGAVFTHKVIKGASDKSYGIEVAKLAGLPESVIARAEEILGELESADKKKPAAKKTKTIASEGTASLLNYKRNNALEELKTLPLNDLTPVEVLNFVAKLQKELL